MPKSVKKSLEADELTLGRAQIKNLRSALDEERKKFVAIEKQRNDYHEQIKQLTAERDWHKELGRQAEMFLLAITNSAVLSGRGWMETKRRLNETCPESPQAWTADMNFKWTKVEGDSAFALAE